MSPTKGEPNITWLMKIDEVALYFRVTVQTVRRWIEVGELHAVRLPNKKLDMNPNFDPDKPKSKWRPATEAKSTLYVSWDALIAKARVYYGTEEKK